MSPDDSLVVCHLFQDASAILLWGACSYLFACVPSTLSSAIIEQMRTVFRVAASILLLAITVAFPVQSAFVRDGWVDAANLSSMNGVLFETSIGPVWFAHALLSLAIILTAMLSAARIGPLALFSGLFLSCHDFFGHAVRLQGMASWALHLSYLLHVLAAAAWLGALVRFIAILRKAGSHLQNDSALAMRNFSTVGHYVVGCIVFTGLLNAWLIHGRLWPVIWSSLYDHLLTAKVLVVLSMVIVAVCNRYIIVPKLKHEPRAARALFWLGCTGVVLGRVGFVLVNVFSTLDQA